MFHYIVSSIFLYGFIINNDTDIIKYLYVNSEGGEPVGSPLSSVSPISFVLYFNSSSAIITEQRIKFRSCSFPNTSPFQPASYSSIISYTTHFLSSTYCDDDVLFLLSLMNRGSSQIILAVTLTAPLFCESFSAVRVSYLLSTSP